MSDQPEWLAAAWRELGQSERAGKAANPRIAAFFKEAGHPGVKSDEVAWCAAFAGACLQRAGLKSTGSLMARSYLGWGEKLESERLGAVAVLSRGADPALGHVGFLVGWTADWLWLLGGNQMNAVSVGRYERSRLIGLRWGASRDPKQAEDVEQVKVKDQEKDTVKDIAKETTMTTDDVFPRALAHVLEMEGGYTDDPHDPGGPTNKGITLETLAVARGVKLTAKSRTRLIADLKAIADWEVEDIYRRRYWQPSGAGEMPAALAVMHFDASVNHGVSTAIRMLQEAVGATADGEIGQQTRSAIERHATDDLLAAYAALRRKRYEGLPHFWRFGRGWLRRVEATLAKATEIARQARPSPSIPPPGDIEMTTSTTTTKASPEAKWWGHSLTIWGALTTAVAAVLPVLGPALGLSLDAETVRQVGTETLAALQAMAALMGTVMTILGRVRASRPLERRNLVLKL